MEKITYSNGLRVLLKQESRVRTVSFGFWIKSGSAYESRDFNGTSHFLEHMAFKGTKTLSSRQIAEGMDAIGGQMNAYTAKEYTCYYGKTLSEHLEKAFRMLAEMVTAPRLDPEDIRTEKNVIMEEISMTEDLPEDRVVENQYGAVWQNSVYGMPILGGRESVGRIGEKELKAQFRARYSPDKIVVAVCGSFDRNQVLELVEQFFAALPCGNPVLDDLRISYCRSCVLQQEEQEQTHICLCLPGVDSLSPEIYALNTLNLAVGGSTSSRLFQRIREELGLAYTIDSGTSCYQSGGLFEIQTAVNPSMAEKTVKEILGELETLRKGVTPEEFCRAREQLKAGLLMGMESNSAQAGHLGRGELLKGGALTEDELLAKINEVTLDEVNDAAKKTFDFDQLSVSVVGPELHESFYQEIGGAL